MEGDLQEHQEHPQYQPQPNNVSEYKFAAKYGHPQKASFLKFPYGKHFGMEVAAGRCWRGGFGVEVFGREILGVEFSAWTFRHGRFATLVSATSNLRFWDR